MSLSSENAILPPPPQPTELTPTPKLPPAPPSTPLNPWSPTPFTAEWLHEVIISPHYSIIAMRNCVLLDPSTKDLKARISMLTESCDALSAGVQLQMQQDHAKRKEADQKDGITVGGWKDRTSRRAARLSKEKENIKLYERMIGRCEEVAKMARELGRTIGASERLNTILAINGPATAPSPLSLPLLSSRPRPPPRVETNTNTFGSGITGDAFSLWDSEISSRVGREKQR